MYFLVWTVIVQQIMVLHWRLFKRGVWFNTVMDRDADGRARERVGCFEFCRGIQNNPVAAILNALGAMLFDPDGAGEEALRLVHFKHGADSSEWPQALLEELQASAVIAFCLAWRYMFFPFLLYPWPLAVVFDPLSTAEVVDTAIANFLRIPKGSKRLDPGLGRKVRELVNTPEQLKAGSLHTTLRMMFERIVITSTFVERLFKTLTAWTARTPQALAAVGAHHCNEVFASVVKQWRTKNSYTALDPPGKAIRTALILLYFIISLLCEFGFYELL